MVVSLGVKPGLAPSQGAVMFVSLRDRNWGSVLSLDDEGYRPQLDSNQHLSLLVPPEGLEPSPVRLKGGYAHLNTTEARWCRVQGLNLILSVFSGALSPD
jgi:hypothetical protein